MAIKLDLNDRESLLKSATTSLSSKIVSQYSGLLAPIAVDSVLRVVDPAISENVDLKDIRLVQKVGGTIDDTEMIDGLVLTQNVIKAAGGPTRMEKAKIGLIQFQLSPPKPDVRITDDSLGSSLDFSHEVLHRRWRTRLSSTTIAKWIRS